MRKAISVVREFVLWVSLPALLGAQDEAPHRPVNTYHPLRNNYASLLSPEVRADRTVTFRISAPGATEVSVFAATELTL